MTTKLKSAGKPDKIIERIERGFLAEDQAEGLPRARA
jgi:hypothetical protein